MKKRIRSMVLAALALVGGGLAPRADAHCDTMDGPVVAVARKALTTGDPAPVLAWVTAEHEAEILAALASARAVRGLSPGALELADRYFFETLVRIHREGEGAPYTGLKPAGTADPAARAADEALAEGDVAELAAELSKAVASGIETRFARVLAAKKRAGESVEAGREYVEAYVKYVHYVEAVHGLAAGGTAHEKGE